MLGWIQDLSEQGESILECVRDERRFGYDSHSQCGFLFRVTTDNIDVNVWGKERHRYLETLTVT